MSTEITEASILEALHKVPQEKWGLVLEILHNLEPREAQLPESHLPDRTDPTRWTLDQLRALPPAEREAIMEAQVLLAVNDYPLGLDDDYSDYLDDPDASAR